MEKFIEAVLSIIVNGNSAPELTTNEIQLLNSFPSEIVQAELLKIFNEATNDTIKSRAFDALLYCNNFDKVSFLIETFNKSSFGWQTACCKELANEKDPRAMSKFCDILMSDDNGDLRYIAAEALGDIGTIENVNVIKVLEYARQLDEGTDYEGFRISDMAEESINKIYARNSQ